MKFWGEHRHVMAPTPFPESAWQCTKIGGRFGTVPHGRGLADVLSWRDNHL